VEILSGKALNAWLLKLQDLPEKGAGPRVALDARLLVRINVTRIDGNGGLALLRKGGQLDWPATLKGAAFDAERVRVDSLLPDAVKQAKEGEVKPRTVEQLNQAREKLVGSLADGVNDLTPSQYIEARRFLYLLGDALKVLQEKDVRGTMAAAAGLPGKCKTVAELAQYMTDSKLRFAPALGGDEAAYVELERALGTYARGALSRPKD
jgi:hypothetical protein